MPTGNIQISLPYTCADLTDQGGQTAFAVLLFNTTGLTGADTVYARVDEGNDYFFLQKVDANGVDTTLTYADISDSNIEIIINGHYPVA